MSLVLKLAFLFFIGSLFGWGLEVVFRKFFSSANPEHKWINPGFCIGPYIPLYGFGLSILYLISSLEDEGLISDPVWNKVILFIAMAVAMTIIEYIAGIMLLKIFKLRLWDYSKLWGNIEGLVCPLFSIFWSILGAVYYFLIHPHILDALTWLSQNLAFSFFVGMFYGVFIIDVVYSGSVVTKIKKFAEEKGVIVKYESLKADIQRLQQEQKQRTWFMFPFRSKIPLEEHFEHYVMYITDRAEKIKTDIAEEKKIIRDELTETSDMIKASIKDNKEEIKENIKAIKEKFDD